MCRVASNAKKVLKDLWKELASVPEDLTDTDLSEADFKAALSFCNKSSSANGIANMISLARSEPSIPFTEALFDKHEWFLNCKNGTVNLQTAELQPHDPTDYITKLCPVRYDPDAECPRWKKFVEEVMAGKKNLMEYLQRVIGYSLTGSVREQCMWFMYGGGSNGKSTLLRVLQHMMGDYACTAVADLLIRKSTQTHPTERTDLFGKRLVSTVEVEDGKRLAESLFKQLTGDDPIRARRMNEDFWEFLPTFKLFLAANNKPMITGTDHAVWRRIKMIPFEVTFTDETKDVNLREKLHKELPGILAWAVRGCQDWLQNGLGEPDDVKEATADYRRQSDILGQFIEERCRTGEGKEVSSTYLLEKFNEWVKCNFPQAFKDMSANKFADMMERKGFEKKRGTTGERLRYWIGIELKDPFSPTDHEDTD
jgi:putative DNA primase/helicase